MEPDFSLLQFPLFCPAPHVLAVMGVVERLAELDDAFDVTPAATERRSVTHCAILLLQQDVTHQQILGRVRSRLHFGQLDDEATTTGTFIALVCVDIKGQDDSGVLRHGERRVCVF